MTLRLLLLVGVLALAGCSTTGGGPVEDLPEPPDPSAYKQDVGVSEAWSYSKLKLPAQGRLALQAAVAADRVYLAGSDGQVLALDRESGKPVWRVNVERSLSAGPGVAGNLLVVGSREGQVIALSAEDGSVRWRSELTSEVLAPPRVASGLVVVRTLDGRVFGLEPAGGKRRWMFEQSVPALTLRGVSAPVLVPGRLVAVGLDTGKLVGLDPAEGKQLWETVIGAPRGRSDLERMVDIDADPVMYRGDIYVVSYQGQLAAVDPASGRFKWQRELSAHAGLAVDADRIYVTDAERRIWAFDRFTGASVWREDSLRGASLTGPAIAGDYLIVGDSEGYLNWLSPQDGSLQRRQKIGGAFVATPQVEADGIYLLTEDGLTVLR